MQHYNIIVSGFVQGVGFRYATLKTAQQLQIKGFVKNEPNGNVYIEAEGEIPNILNFVRWCNTGSSFARVTNIESNDGEVKNFTSFTIKY